MRPLLDCCCGRHVARKHILRLRLRPATAQSRSRNPFRVTCNGSNAHRFCNAVQRGSRPFHSVYCRGEAPQYPQLLHPVACAAPRAWTCGSRTCSSCSLTAILSLLPSPMFAVLAACGEAPLRLRLYPCGPPALRHAPLASGQCWRHMMWSVGLERACHT